MPTDKPRLTITLDPDTHNAIAALAAARDVSKGAVIREFLDPAAPIIWRIANLIRHANRVTGAAADEYVASLDRSQGLLEAILPDLLDQFAEAEALALSEEPPEADAASRRAASGGSSSAASADPLALTGGSESPNPLKNNKRAKTAKSPHFSQVKGS